MNARDLIHLAERVYVITMPDNGHGSDRYLINDEETFVEQIAQHPSFNGHGSDHYLINDEETFVEQIAQHPSFKGYEGPHASGTYVLTFEADTPATEQMRWIAQVLSGTDLNDGHGGLIRCSQGGI
jgi:hypothetical protein